jgi:DNA-binding HxlR family transcriptional regulator
MTLLQGPLADRDAWSAVGECAIEKTMAVVGTKSAMLIMREAYYGTTRFDDFARRVGITKAATSARLSELVELGLLRRQPYREPGQRSRDEYVLTDAGIAFMPVVWAMFEWGRRHLPGRNRLRLVHLGCGAEAGVEIRCAEGHLVAPDELGMRLAKKSGCARSAAGAPRRRGARRPRSVCRGRTPGRPADPCVRSRAGNQRLPRPGRKTPS